MNFKVSFYLRSNYENKEGKSPVMLRVFLGGEMANFDTTKIFVKKSFGAMPQVGLEEEQPKPCR